MPLLPKLQFSFLSGQKIFTTLFVTPLSQCQSVISHIEGQTSGMTDASDKTYIMENLGKRYRSVIL